MRRPKSSPHRKPSLHAAIAAIFLASACSVGGSTSGAPSADACERTAASLAACGGLQSVVAAARAEGTLNVIALPRDWANYGAVIDGFQAAYGIKVNSENPNGVSADEIAAAKADGASKVAPDVFDLSSEVAWTNSALFAPYRVVTWESIPFQQKDPGARWVEDYGGYMAIGYDSSRLLTLGTGTIDQFLSPSSRLKVAIEGDPNRSDSALGAVLMATVAEGGTLDEPSIGVTWFHQLKATGHYTSVVPTPMTINAHATPVVFDWDYMALARGAGNQYWRVVVPDYATVGGYFAQAINLKAPHPAAARLWEEYLYSDTGQNLLLHGNVRPVRMDAMQAAGTLDQQAAQNLPPVTGVFRNYVSPYEVGLARGFLSAQWAAAVS